MFVILFQFIKTILEIASFLIKYAFGKTKIDETVNGGDLVAKVLKTHRVKHAFTLCGGHISSILVGCERNNIKVIDCRSEATAAFAAEAYGRLHDIGVVVVTAGPGFTNTITAMRNASLSESPVIFIAGAVALSLRGMGALQDCDQVGIAKVICKYSVSIKKAQHIIPEIMKAIKIAKTGIPGPVFVELSVDLSYPSSIICDEINKFTKGSSMGSKLLRLYMNMFKNYILDSPNLHINMLYKDIKVKRDKPDESVVRDTHNLLLGSRRPVIIVGTQCLVNGMPADTVRHALQKIGLPTYLSGMARGLLNKKDIHLYKHNRSQVLREADLIILAGVTCDFRMSYGLVLNRKALIIVVNISKTKAKLNHGYTWKASKIILSHPGEFLVALAETKSNNDFKVYKEEWLSYINEKESKAIKFPEHLACKGIDPVSLFACLDELLNSNSVIVGDGGDFVATAAYILSPRKPFSWFDAGPYGTLGAGAGYGLACSLNQNSEVWIIYGDGSCGYSIIDIDTFVRHGLNVIMLIGNDAGWSQILRGQESTFTSDVACRLLYSHYEMIAEAFGAKQILLDEPGIDNDNIKNKLQEARLIHESGKSVIVNIILRKSNFRKDASSF